MPFLSGKSGNITVGSSNCAVITLFSLLPVLRHQVGRRDKSRTRWAWFESDFLHRVFEEERKSLVPYIGPFDGFHCVPASISKTCTVRFDNNNTRLFQLQLVAL